MANSQNVDERIVEMRIDNRKFENGAKQTISTLEKLERALHLKGDASGFNELSDRVSKFDASPMANSLDKVQASFSALEIAGLRVISNLTDSVYNFTAKTLKSFTIDPITAGFNKFGEKTTSVATLVAQGYELEKVNGLMEDLIWFTDETSYNFTDMVGNIAKFTAAGQDLDESVTAMEGIALWAALSGQNATKASQAMYQLSQAMSKGALKYDDWKSIANASMDTQEFRKQAAAAAVELGVLRETADGLFEVIGTGTSKNGPKTFDLGGLFSSDAMSRTAWFNSDVMMRVFNKYSKAVGEVQRYMDEMDIDTASAAMEELEDRASSLAEELGITLDEAFQQLGYDLDEFSLKALKAGQNARTWSDVVDSVKDAVSTGWMTTFEIMFGDAEEATEFWTSVANKFWDLFAGGGENRNSLLKIAFGSSKDQKETAEGVDKVTSGWGRLQSRVASSGHTMEQFEEAFYKVIDDTNNVQMEKVVRQYHSVEEAFKQGAVSADVFKLVLAELKGMTHETASDVEAGAEQMNASLDDMRKVALEVLAGEHGNGQERIDWLKENGYDPEVIQAMAGQLKSFHDEYGSYEMSDEKLVAAMERYYRYNRMAERLGAGSFAEFLGSGASGISDTNAEIDETVDLLEDADGLLEDIRGEVGRTLEDTDEYASGGEAFRQGLLNILDFFVSINEMISGEGGAIENVFGTIEERGLRLRHILGMFANFTRDMKLSEDALKGLQKIVESVLRVFRIFATAGSGGIKIVYTAILTLKGIVDDILALIGRGEFSVGEALDAIQKRLQAAIPSTEQLKNGFQGIVDRIKNGLPTEKEFLNFMKSVKDAAKSGLQSIKDWGSALTFENIKGYLPRMERLKEIYHSITGYIWENYPTIAAWLHDLKETSVLGAAFDGLTNFFRDAGNWVSGLGVNTEKLNTYLSQFSEIVSFIFGSLFGDPEEFKNRIESFVITAFEGIKNAFKSITFGDIFKAFKMAGLTVLLSEIAGIVNSFRNIEKEIQGIPESLSKMFSSAGDAFTNLGKVFKATSYLEIAAAIGILAGSMWLLSKIPQDDLTHVASVLVILGLAISKLMSYMSGDKTNNFRSNNTKINITVISKFASILLGFGVLVASAAALFLVVKNIDIPKMVGAFFGIAFLIAAITVAIGYMSKLDNFNSKGVILTLLAFASAIDMLVIPMAELAVMPFNNWLKAVFGVIGLLAAMSTAIFVMSRLDKSGSTDNILKTAGAMALLAVAINLMIPVLTALALMPAKSFGKGFAGLIGIIAVLIGIVGAFALLDKKVKSENILKWAAAFAIVALAMNLMIPAVIGFSTAFGILLSLASKTNNFAKTMLKLAALAGVLAVFSVVAIAFAAAIGILGIGLFAAGAGMILFAFGLGLMVKPMKKAKEAFPAFIEGLKQAGEMLWGNKKMVLLGAAAFIAFAVAIFLLISAFTKLFKIGNIGTKLAGLGRSLIGGVGSIVKSLGTKITESLPQILDILGAVMITIGLYLIGLIPQFTELAVTAIISLFDSVANSLSAHKEQLVKSVTSMLSTIFDVVSSVLESVFSKDFYNNLSGTGKILFNLATLKIGTDLLNVATPFKQLKSVLGKGEGEESLPFLLDKSKGLIEKLIGSAGGLSVLGPIAVALGVSFAYAGANVNSMHEQYRDEAAGGQELQTLEDYAAAIERAKEAVAQAQADYDNAALYSPEGLWSYDEVLTARETVLNNLVAEYERLKTKSEEAAKAEAAYNEEAKASTDTPVDLSAQQAVVDQTQSAVTSVEEGTNRIKDSLKALGFSLEDFGLNTDFSGMGSDEINSLATELESLASNIPEGIGLGIANNEAGAVNPIKDLVQSLITTYMTDTKTNSPSELFAEQAAYIPEGIGVGIERNRINAITPLSNLVTELINSFGNLHDHFYNSGVSIVQGLVNGIDANSLSAYNTGWNLASSVESGFRDRLEIHSPSRVFMQLASYIPKGITQGIKNEEDSTITEVVGFGSLLIDAISKAMSQVGYIASDDFTISPRIVPIVDMSNVDYAAGSMDSLFNGRHRSYIDGINGRMSNVDYAKYESLSSSSGDSGLSAQVMHLSDQIDILGERITNMQIILDTGVMVGQTSAKMDQQLGRMAARKGRGN